MGTSQAVVINGGLQYVTRLHEAMLQHGFFDCHIYIYTYTYSHKHEEIQYTSIYISLSVYINSFKMSHI